MQQAVKLDNIPATVDVCAHKDSQVCSSSQYNNISINANIFEKLKVQMFVAGRKSAEMC